MELMIEWRAKPGYARKLHTSMFPCDEEGGRGLQGAGRLRRETGQSLKPSELLVREEEEQQVEGEEEQVVGEEEQEVGEAEQEVGHERQVTITLRSRRSIFCRVRRKLRLWPEA